MPQQGHDPREIPVGYKNTLYIEVLRLSVRFVLTPEALGTNMYLHSV